MDLSGISGKKILYGCLEWGSGHVYRSIPVIRQLASQGNELLIYCSPNQKAVFLRYLQHRVDYHIGFQQDFQFTGSGNFAAEIWRNRSHFFSSRKLEKQRVAGLVKAHGIGLILSDHRYGLVSEECQSVFLTHQLHLPAGFLSNWRHNRMMYEFSDVAVFDNPERPLAGKLSKGAEPAQYIGWHSRFAGLNSTEDSDLIVAVLSGPDTYARQLLGHLPQLKKQFPGNWKIISATQIPDGAVETVTDPLEADELIASASRIVSRSGYTTLMDLEFLQKPAILVPTAGQYEQEYLAKLQEERKDRTIIRI